MRSALLIRRCLAVLVAFSLGALLPFHHHDDADVGPVARSGECDSGHGDGHHHHGNHDEDGERGHSDCPVCHLARTLTLQAFIASPVPQPLLVKESPAAAPERPVLVHTFRVYDSRGPPSCC
jgi:hypothetical protein